MVSRYAVDVVLIAGLVVGTMGVLYLTQGLFGQRGNRVLRWLFAALILSMFWAFVWVMGDWAGNPYKASTFFGLPEAAAVAIVAPLATIWFVAIYAPIYYVAKPLVSSQRVEASVKQIKQILPWAIPIGFVIGATFELVETTYVKHQSLEQAVIRSLSLGISLGAFVAVVYVCVAIIATRPKERQQQIIGLILTLLGIATQFIPPVLDLLNIKFV